MAVVVAGSVKFVPFGFWLGQVPPMDVPWPIGIPLKFMIFWLEAFGLLIKHFVLAMRLLTNMMAGHVVLAVFVAFIALRPARWLFLAWSRPACWLRWRASLVEGLFVASCVHIRVFVRTVHRDGCPSPLISTEAYAM